MSNTNTIAQTAPATRVDQGGYSAMALLGFQDRTIRLLLCAAIFLMVVGARWWMIGKLGSDVPFWDQWDAEAANLYKKYYDGTLTLGDWFAPHNEHRILFTRILAFGLLMANGQWDPRLQMEVNAIIYAGVASGLFIIFSRERSIRFSILCSAGLAVMFTFPFGWENTLGGFQSQFYFLAVFTLASLYLLVNSTARSWAWTMGILSGGMALFTMSSGLLSPAAVLGVIALVAIRGRHRWRELLNENRETILFCTLLIVVGISLTVKVEGHIQYQAHSLIDFIKAFAAGLSWPCRPMTLWFILSWIPYGLFMKDYLAGQAKDGPQERFLLGLGLWVILQTAAIAFARVDHVHASRYADLLSYGLMVNALSAAWVSWNRGRSQYLRYLMVTWLIVNAVALFDISFNGAADKRKQSFDIKRNRTAAFVATEDFRYLIPIKDAGEIPYPDPKRLKDLLQDSSIQQILPVGVRKALTLMPAQGSPSVSFVQPVVAASDIVAPELLARVGEMSRFAFISSPQRFAYRVTKEGGLPFLYLSIFGKTKNLSVSIIDSNGASHAVIPLPSEDAWPWHHGFAYCPSVVCTISGSDSSGVALLEPKEIGPLSIIAMAAGSRGGRYLFSVGATLFSVILLSFILNGTGSVRRACIEV